MTTHGRRTWTVLTLATVWWWPVVTVGADPSGTLVLDRTSIEGWPTSSEVGNTNSTSEFVNPTAKAMGHPTPRITGVGALVLSVDVPRVAITDIPFKGLTLTLSDEDGAAVTEPTGPVTLEGVQWVTAAGEAADPPENLQIVDGRVVVSDALARVTDGRITLRLENGRAYTTQVRLLPGWQSILPPLIAIAAGLLIRQIVVPPV